MSRHGFCTRAAMGPRKLAARPRRAGPVADQRFALEAAALEKMLRLRWARDSEHLPSTGPHCHRAVRYPTRICEV